MTPLATQSASNAASRRESGASGKYKAPAKTSMEITSEMQEIIRIHPMDLVLWLAAIALASVVATLASCHLIQADATIWALIAIAVMQAIKPLIEWVVVSIVGKIAAHVYRDQGEKR